MFTTIRHTHYNNNNNKTSLHNTKSVKKIFTYGMRIIKKIPLFPKNLVYFGCFTTEVDFERGKQDLSNKVINTKMPGKRVSKYIIQLVNFNWSTKANLQRKSPICSP